MRLAAALASQAGEIQELLCNGRSGREYVVVVRIIRIIRIIHSTTRAYPYISMDVMLCFNLSNPGRVFQLPDAACTDSQDSAAGTAPARRDFPGGAKVHRSLPARYLFPVLPGTEERLDNPDLGRSCTSKPRDNKHLGSMMNDVYFTVPRYSK